MRWQGLAKIKPVSSAIVSAIPLSPVALLLGERLNIGFTRLGDGLWRSLLVGVTPPLKFLSGNAMEIVPAGDTRLDVISGWSTELRFVSHRRSGRYRQWRFEGDRHRRT